MVMIRLTTLLVFFQSAILLAFAGDNDESVSYVNPFIGTAQTLKKSNWEGHGRVYPGAVSPFGYIQLTPETRVNSGKGYDYSDEVVYFFSCMRHMSGYPNGSSGHCIVQPIENADSFELRKDHRPFSHQNEKAAPGYYKLEFDDNGTIVEASTATRSGMFRFSYKSLITPKIFIGDIGKIELVNDSIIKSSSRNIVIKFDEAWHTAKKSGDGIILTFDIPEDKAIQLKLSSSSVSYQNAKENLHAEIPDWSFDELKRKAYLAWNNQLSVIEVNDNSKTNKTKFYSAFYHSLLIPWIVSDVNGEYQGRDRKVYKAKGTDHYEAFSPWDTFRSLHPLLCLIAPKRQNDMIISMLEIYEQTGQIPITPMTGYHSIPIIVDSYFKGITNFDKSLAYRAMKDCLLDEPFFYEDMEAYIQNGYIPASYPESVTRTVEYAYDDWALSRFAKSAVNEHEDYRKLYNRSFNYRGLFDPQQMFLVPKGEEGFVKSIGNFGFKEGDKWNYSLFVPHNTRDIINHMGGDNEFSMLLDSAIRNDHIVFDNEPNFHIPYLFNYSKTPSKTQEWIAEIRETYFNSAEHGLPGNDDLGSMSSWFVFNALGIYPVCPGIPQYNIGTPLFDEVIIHLKENKTFVIKGSDVSMTNKYIQTATLNGALLANSWVSHASIIAGGELNLKMGSNPSKWATQAGSAAYSATEKEANIIVDNVVVNSEYVTPHELIWVKFRLLNKGSKGVKIVRISADGFEKAKKNITVEEGEIKIDSISCRLYKPGFAELSIVGSDKKIKINVKKSDKVSIEYEELSFLTLVQDTAKQQIGFSLKNIGGISVKHTNEIFLNGNLEIRDTVALEPGESQRLIYHLSGYEVGMNKIEVGNLTGIFKVYKQKFESTLFDLSIQNESNGKLLDRSGLSNHGIIKSLNPITFFENGFDENAYLEIKRNSTFSSLQNEITLMCWVRASDENRHLSSIITQGDHNVIQFINNNQIEFFIGGWGRGICLVDLPPSFIGKWHHIAGVCDESTLKVYLDGELKGTAELHNEAVINGHSNWYLGRNEEFPNKRIFYGKMNGVKLFATALSQEEIRKIIESEKMKILKK